MSLPINPLDGVELKELLEAVPAAAFVFDRQGKLVCANREAMRLFSFRSFDEAANEFSGPNHPIRVTTLDGVPVKGPGVMVARALAGEKVADDLKRVAPLDGRPDIVVRVIMRPILGREGAIVGVLKIAEDVTEEYELTRRKEEFVRVTTHELRTPITALRLGAEALLRGDRTDCSRVRRTAESIVRATRRIEAISVTLNDVAALAAGETIAIEPTLVQLDELAADVVSSLESDQATRVHLVRRPASVRADAMRVRGIVAALLDNALRYSAAPSPIEVEVKTVGGMVELSVTDHGIGIPAEERPHIFEPFHRAHTGTPFDRGGLGASLYLAAEIMKRHGGRIWFESSKRDGTSFHLAFEDACVVRGGQPIEAWAP